MVRPQRLLLVDHLVGPAEQLPVAAERVHREAPDPDVARLHHVARRLNEPAPEPGVGPDQGLRAAELHEFGMQGVGRIFEDYRSGHLEDDDEVAIIHAPADMGFKALSVPMVSVRATLQSAVADEVLPQAVASEICKHAKALHYADREWDRILADASENSTDLPELKLFEAWLPENFVDAIGILGNYVEQCGGKLIGFSSADGYKFESSKALRDDKFCGLALDFENMARTVKPKIKAWVEQITKEFK